MEAVRSERHLTVDFYNLHGAKISKSFVLDIINRSIETACSARQKDESAATNIYFKLS